MERILQINLVEKIPQNIENSKALNWLKTKTVPSLEVVKKFPAAKQSKNLKLCMTELLFQPLHHTMPSLLQIDLKFAGYDLVGMERSLIYTSKD
jgi:hypothetical protein